MKMNDNNIDNGYILQIESNDDHINDLDSALPDYMWNKEAKNHFKNQKNRKKEEDVSETKLKSGEKKEIEEKKKQEYCFFLNNIGMIHLQRI